eukprot:PhM_4_TR17427/c1_g2_i6/m.87425
MDPQLPDRAPQPRSESTTRCRRGCATPAVFHKVEWLTNPFEFLQSWSSDIVYGRNRSVIDLCRHTAMWNCTTASSQDVVERKLCSTFRYRNTDKGLNDGRCPENGEVLAAAEDIVNTLNSLASSPVRVRFARSTILGPQLFNVNDLAIPCTPVMYADDLTIIYGGYPFESIQLYIQEAVNVVVRWAAEHNMIISPKTEGLLFFLLFSNNLNIPLQIDIRCGDFIIPLQLHSEHSPVRLLGVMFDSKLTFRHHRRANPTRWISSTRVTTKKRTVTTRRIIRGSSVHSRKC